MGFLSGKNGNTELRGLRGAEDPCQLRMGHSGSFLKRGLALSLLGQGALGQGKMEGGHPGRGRVRLEVWTWVWVVKASLKRIELWGTVGEIPGKVSGLSR